MGTHIEKLVNKKRVAIRQATLQGICAAVLVMIGGTMRHAWGASGEVIAAVGLLMCGWFARSMFDADRIETLLNESVAKTTKQGFMEKVKRLTDKYEVQIGILCLILVHLAMGWILGWGVLAIWVGLIVVCGLKVYG